MKADPVVQASYALAVVDTNVLLSAALSPGGTPAILVDGLLEISKLVFSAATFAELETRIWLPKFDRYLSIERRRRLLSLTQSAAVWVDIPAALAERTFSSDHADNAFIHAALAAGALRLITGDDDLLCLHPLDTLHILTPRQALDEIQAGA
ncbi:MAG: putative toxin-antitoxin system toxin component, PIN family [Dechloromonas sp.]|jgi:putative PIN family toxin of toxin-antitoxin system|nr:MAG: putative toxin-antitoxin system toxin component, PIN family [Dechloromonas sp.]